MTDETQNVPLDAYLEVLQNLQKPEVAAQILKDYSDALQAMDEQATVFDETKLPHAKDEIKRAFVYGFMIAHTDAPKLEQLHQGYVLLSRFQPLARMNESQIDEVVALEQAQLEKDTKVWHQLLTDLNVQEEQNKQNKPDA